MTLLSLVACVFAIGIIEHEQYKDLRDRNKRQGLASAKPFLFREKYIQYYENNTHIKGEIIMKNKENIVVAMMLTVVMVVVITMGVSMGPSLREAQPSYEEVHEFLSLGIDE